MENTRSIICPPSHQTAARHACARWPLDVDKCGAVPARPVRPGDDCGPDGGARVVGAIVILKDEPPNTGPSAWAESALSICLGPRANLQCQGLRSQMFPHTWCALGQARGRFSYAGFILEPLAIIGIDPGSDWRRSGVDLCSTQGCLGVSPGRVDLGPAWDRSGVESKAIWGQGGLDLGGQSEVHLGRSRRICAQPLVRTTRRARRFGWRRRTATSLAGDRPHISFFETHNPDNTTFFGGDSLDLRQNHRF